MTHTHRFGLLLLVSGLCACGLFYTDFDDYACPPGGTDLTYDNFGASFINAHCQSCHGSESNDRQGAPGEFIFDTHEQVIRHKERIFVRSAAENDSMPPGPDDPPLDERMKLADWLACGAP